MCEELKVRTGEVAGNEEIAKDVFRMEIICREAAERALPGQFVNVYLSRQDLLLPRPISICRAREGRVTLVYGAVGRGTKLLSWMRPGESISLSDPLGRGYRLLDVPSAMLVGGGIGVPPLLETAERLREMGVSVTAVLGFRDQAFLEQEFRSAGAGVYLATDSGAAGFHGTVVDLIRSEDLTAESYYACGPRPMLCALTSLCRERGQDAQVSLEERMGCGYGACVGCVCKIRGENSVNKEALDGTEGGYVRKKVCKDGPVFWGSEVIWNA